MTIQGYVDRVNQRYKTGILVEDGYREDLKMLLETITSDVVITYEPTRIACGAPDYIITDKNIPVAYVEAKDIGKPLESHEYKEQLDRYKRSLSNLIITDHLEFHFYRDGEFMSSVSIGELQNGQVISKPESYETFKALIRNACKYTGVTIRSAAKLAKMMAGTTVSTSMKFWARAGKKRATRKNNNYVWINRKGLFIRNLYNPES
jgi:hypothetical protein